MSTWNYRVIELDRSSPEERWLEVREVYYGEDGGIRTISESASPIVGNEPDELRAVHAMLAEAFEKPILVESELPPSDASDA